MPDDDRELTGDEAMQALGEFIARGRRAQRAADLMRLGIDPATGPDRTAWICGDRTCDFTTGSAREMVEHARTVHGWSVTVE